jgi:short-subunit dehydrogenase involved in D-alanine esterification of teichoic acids
LYIIRRRGGIHMNLSGNTILITGGASGIGLAFAERFLKNGNEVIIVGRANSIFQGFENGELEIGYGGTENRLKGSREENLHGAKMAWKAS